MQIQTIQLHNFRCFSQLQLTFDAPLVLLSGLNGTGKTSVLEALHYACYLRSFRTHLPRELLHFEQPHFFIKIGIQADLIQHEIQVGFSGKKKMVKVDQKSVSSYKELLHYYRTVTLTEDDLIIVKGGPEERRLFLDQAILLENPDYGTQIKQLRHIVQQRNALLMQRSSTTDLQLLWTEQLWHSSQAIQKVRETFLMDLISRVQNLLDSWFDNTIQINAQYRPRAMLPEQSYAEFVATNDTLFIQELAMQRSLFGAHLDDFILSFRGKISKLYASRGQQKLVILLLKIAQLQRLVASKGQTIFLLDDFMNDFDPLTAERLLALLLGLESQLIFTSPAGKGFFDEKLLNRQCQHHILST